MRKQSIRVTAVVLLCLCLLRGGAAAATVFPDVKQNYWGYTFITKAHEAGLVNGDTDGFFWPERQVKNAEFISMLGNLFFRDEVDTYAAAHPKASQANWWYAFMTMAYSKGLLNSTTVGLARQSSQSWSKSTVESSITRYDMAQMMYNISLTQQWPLPSEEALSEAKLRIADWNEVPKQYQQAVSSAFALKFLSGYTDGSFQGSEYMTRGEAAVVICRMMDMRNGTLETTAPEEQNPGETAPETEPGETTPETDPGETTPETEPGETTPETDPGETTPETEPGESAPETEPGESAPETDPGETSPETEPGETAPETDPGEPEDGEDGMTAETVALSFEQLQEDYPQGTLWNVKQSYTSPALGTASESQGFLFLASDAVFGSLPAVHLKHVTDVKAGDLIYFAGSDSYAVVYKREGDTLSYLTCSNRGTISWTSTGSVNDLTSLDEVLTRYKLGPVTQESEIEAAMETFRTLEFPEDSVWDLEERYRSSSFSTGIVRGSQAFAYYTSDYLFGKAEDANVLEVQSASSLRVGDVIRNGSNYLVAVSVDETYDQVTCLGITNTGHVSWHDTVLSTQVLKNCTVYTRY